MFHCLGGVKHVKTSEKHLLAVTVETVKTEQSVKQVRITAVTDDKELTVRALQIQMKSRRADQV